MSAFLTDVSGFFESVAYGFVVLVVPVFIWTSLLTLIMVRVAKWLDVELSATLVTVFVMSFSLIGSVSGSIAGATLESIVGAVLAAVLGLVSSLLTYLFGKEELRAWRPLIPLALIALLSSTLMGLVIGGSRKTQSLRERAAAEQAKFEFENADVPALREIRVTLARRCALEKPYAVAVEECE